MLKRGLLIIFLLILPAVLAQNEFESANVVLTFVDAVSKEPIDEVYVNTDLNGETANYFLEKDQTLKLKLSSGEYRLKILIDNPDSRSYDYYGETFLTVERGLVKIIYLYPIGSLDGFVKDKLDTVIADADLKFDCNTIFSVNFPKVSDKFGSFSLDYVPVGNCKVYGSYKDSLGVEEVEIKQGEKNFVEVKLDTILIPPKSKDYSFFGLGFLLFGLFVLLVIGGLAYYFIQKTRLVQRKERQEEKLVKGLKEEIKEVKNLEDLTKREKDIFKTLRDNEKKIVEFLLEQKEPVYFSKIHYKTGLSKGSLFRNLRTLERKNIVETMKEGKVRKVRLSDWFLGR